MKVNTRIGKIKASKDVLNKLSLSLSESAGSLASRGCKKRAKQDQIVSNDIYKALDAVGFYNN